jgi:hypothetical protein
MGYVADMNLRSVYCVVSQIELLDQFPLRTQFGRYVDWIV